METRCVLYRPSHPRACQLPLSTQAGQATGTAHWWSCILYFEWQAATGCVLGARLRSCSVFAPFSAHSVRDSLSRSRRVSRRFFHTKRTQYAHLAMSVAVSCSSKKRYHSAPPRETYSIDRMGITRLFSLEKRHAPPQNIFYTASSETIYLSPGAL